MRPFGGVEPHSPSPARSPIPSSRATVGSRTSEALLPHLLFPPSFLPSFRAPAHVSSIRHVCGFRGLSERQYSFFIFFHLFHFPPSFCFFFFFLSRLPVCHGSAPLLSLHILLLLSSLPLLSSPPIILRVKLICVAAEAGVGGGQGGGRDVESIIDL